MVACWLRNTFVITTDRSMVTLSETVVCFGHQGGRQYNVSVASHQLYGDHEDGLEGEGAVAEVEQVLQAGPQQLQHHGVVLPAWAKVVHLRDALCWQGGNITTKLTSVTDQACLIVSIYSLVSSCGIYVAGNTIHKTFSNPKIK